MPRTSHGACHARLRGLTIMRRSVIERPESTQNKNQKTHKTLTDWWMDWRRCVFHAALSHTNSCCHTHHRDGEITPRHCGDTTYMVYYVVYICTSCCTRCSPLVRSHYAVYSGTRSHTDARAKNYYLVLGSHDARTMMTIQLLGHEGIDAASCGCGGITTHTQHTRRAHTLL